MEKNRSCVLCVSWVYINSRIQAVGFDLRTTRSPLMIQKLRTLLIGPWLSAFGCSRLNRPNVCAMPSEVANLNRLGNIHSRSSLHRLTTVIAMPRCRILRWLPKNVQWSTDKSHFDHVLHHTAFKKWDSQGINLWTTPSLAMRPFIKSIGGPKKLRSGRE